MSSVEGLEMLRNWQTASTPLELNSKDPVSANKIIGEFVKVVFVDANSLSLLSLRTGETKSVDLTGATFDGGEYSLSIRLSKGGGLSLTPELAVESDSIP